MLKIILTKEQQEVCNGYLHTSNDYCWIKEQLSEYDNIVKFAIIVNHCLNCLEDSGWQTWKVDGYRALDPSTLDLTDLNRSTPTGCSEK